uniref:Uncharacterized protein n=1 Tax=Mustela putorius furo TaxID=9669 RepID=M3YY60_MUSPF
MQKHPSLQAKQGVTTVPWRSRKAWKRPWAPRPLRSPSVGLSSWGPAHQHLSALFSSEAVGCELWRGPWAWCRFSPLTLPPQPHPGPQLPETQQTPEHPASLSPSWPGGSPRGRRPPEDSGLWISTGCSIVSHGACLVGQEVGSRHDSCSVRGPRAP